MGLCPIGKFVFSHEDALRYKARIETELKRWKIEYAGIDGVVKDGIIRGIQDVEPAVRHLKAQGIDGVFLPHCNFGTEHATGLIGRDLGVPVLLWGPRDEAPLPDGTRLRDSLCGLLASSKVLHKLRVPFTYIENCRIGDQPFEAGVMNFVRVMSVVKGMRKLRIGQLGQRIDFFWTTIINESELLSRFGVEVLPLDMVKVIRDTKERARKEAGHYRKEIQKLSSQVRLEGFTDETPLINVLALSDEMLRLAEEHNLSAFAVHAFMSLCEELGGPWRNMPRRRCPTPAAPWPARPTFAGAISLVLLQRASLDRGTDVSCGLYGSSSR